MRPAPGRAFRQWWLGHTLVLLLCRSRVTGGASVTMAHVSAPSLSADSARSRTAASLRIFLQTSTATMPRTSRGLATATATLAAAAVMLLPVAAALQIVLSGQFDDRTRTQAIVVLNSTRVWGDSAPLLNGRIDHAAQLYREGIAPVVVLTGPARQGEAAKVKLIAQGVPERDIVGFVTGQDTTGTLEVIAHVMRDLSWSSATVVTDPAQSARAAATASALGIDAHMSPVKAGPGTALTSENVGRETVALMRFYGMTRWALPQIIR